MNTGKIVDINNLKSFCKNALIKAGMSKKFALITAEVLVETDTYGTHSHGTKNLYNYFKKMQAGGIDINAQPRVLLDLPAIALIDGQAAVGMVPSYLAMEMAIEKAKYAGICYIAVKNSCHFGAAGYYANMAAKQNMIGLAMSNADPNMNVPGGKGYIIGNNPFAYAVPFEERSIFLDIAMSSVAALKVIQAEKDNKAIPDTWVADEDGIPTTDPGKFLDGGSLQPMSGHKGYGLALLVEMLTSIVSGGAIMDEVPSWWHKLADKNNASHAFIVIDPSKFMAQAIFGERVEYAANYLHNAPKAADKTRIYCPGEIEWEKAKNAEENGLLLPPDVVGQLELLAQETETAVPWMA